MPGALDFIISMVLFLFVFSVLVSTFTEIWNTARRRRSACLWAGVGRMLGSGTSDRLLIAELKNHPAITSLASTDGDPASYLPSELFASALVDVLMSLHSEDAQPVPRGIGDVLAGLHGDAQSSKVLQFLWRRAGADPRLFQQHLASHFDQVMDRVSGWYKRGSTQRCFVMGLLCAAALNIDAVHVGRAFWNDPHLAQQYASNGERIVVAYDPAAPATAGSGASEVVKRGYALSLPIGWPARWYQELPANAPLPLSELIWTAAGFLIMACSCLIGAPLWFQLLGALLPLRMAGPQPARSTEPPARPETPSGVPPPVAGGGSGGGNDNDAPNHLEYKLIRNADVKAVQLALGVPETGQFDSVTRSAIARRQAEFGFGKTGQVTRMFLRQLGLGELAEKP